MNVSVLTVIVVLLYVEIVLAQRDPPVWNSYLPRIALFDERTKLEFEVTYNKCGGPSEQSGHSQMYVLGYLEKDEKKILEFTVDKKLRTNRVGKSCCWMFLLRNSL